MYPAIIDKAMLIERRIKKDNLFVRANFSIEKSARGSHKKE